MKKIFYAIFLLLIFSFLGLTISAFTSEQPPKFQHTQITIHSKNSDKTYNVELAITPNEQQYGLMYRKDLESNAGMLFIVQPPRDMKMWMKNTYIPLDMLFIDSKGKIIYIEHNAMPNSLKTIGAGSSSIAAVLELAGGTAKAQNLNIGDIVIYKAFTPEQTANKP